MKRLFIAVDLDDATREAIGAIASDMRQRLDGDSKGTWVKADRLHLTLHFFGTADAALETRLRAALADAIPAAPFGVSFAGVATFPERGAPRVLWLGVREGVDQLREVQRLLSERLGVGEPREFTPHLTLARFRSAARVRYAQIAQIGRMTAAAGPCRIDRVTLYESRLSPAGPAYLPLAEAALTP